LLNIQRNLLNLSHLKHYLSMSSNSLTKNNNPTSQKMPKQSNQQRKHQPSSQTGLLTTWTGCCDS